VKTDKRSSLLQCPKRLQTKRIGPNSEVEVFVKFRDDIGPFVFHCHNPEYEDHAMMARFDVI
jgi:spore coat protein A, manganese oxidase